MSGGGLLRRLGKALRERRLPGGLRGLFFGPPEPQTLPPGAFPELAAELARLARSSEERCAETLVGMARERALASAAFEMVVEAERESLLRVLEAHRRELRRARPPLARRFWLWLRDRPRAAFSEA